MLRSLNNGLSTPTPIAFRPLSTYIRAPVIAEANGDARNAAVFPTSSVHLFLKLRQSVNNASVTEILLYFLGMAK